MTATLPKIGESLDPAKTLESMARRHRFDGDRCRRCRQSPYPRGFVVNLGLCWTCHFRGLTK